MLAAGADPNLRGKEGTCAIFDAAYHGQCEIVALLAPLTTPADMIGPDGHDALMAACGHCDATAALHMARSLIPYADLHRVNAKGHTALMTAGSLGHMDLFEALLALSPIRADSSAGTFILDRVDPELRERIAASLAAIELHDDTPRASSAKPRWL